MRPFSKSDMKNGEALNAINPTSEMKKSLCLAVFFLHIPGKTNE